MLEIGGQRTIYVEVTNCTFTGCGLEAIWARGHGENYPANAWAKASNNLKTPTSKLRIGRGCLRSRSRAQPHPARLDRLWRGATTLSARNVDARVASQY